MAGPGEPGGGAGRAATPRSPSACEPAGARGGRGLAPHGSAVTAAARTAPAPATSHGGGGGGGGGCAAPARLLLLQLLPSGKGRAAAAPPPVPRLPPPAPSPSPAPSPGPPPPQRRARLPSDSPPPVQRRAGGGAAAAKTRPGPLARVGACAVPSPFSGGTEAERCLGARAPGAEAPEGRTGSQPLLGRVASGPGGTAEARGVARCPRWERSPKTLMTSYCSDGSFLSRGNVHNKPSLEKGFWISQSTTKIDISSTFEELTFPK
ncbi:formin-like protein 18 [Rhinolophus ferrumequinum]|uniref:formin-like protein 18 n=1 Tax=Rhinolophus ferrumequinum TaxID=59479 RepID=UPI00140F9A4B|nr:formin-like protein 18 [Rhinolophus ferrumequinum]